PLSHFPLAYFPVRRQENKREENIRADLSKFRYRSQRYILTPLSVTDRLAPESRMTPRGRTYEESNTDRGSLSQKQTFTENSRSALPGNRSLTGWVANTIPADPGFPRAGSLGALLRHIALVERNGASIKR